MATEIFNLQDQVSTAELDHLFDFTPFFGEGPLDTISTYVFSSSSGITLFSDSNDDYTVRVWLKDGTPGTVYRVSCKITTVGNRVDTMHADIRIPYVTPAKLYLDVGPNDVRRVLGLDVGELPDDDINIQSAAILVRYAITSTVFNTALSAQDHTTIWLNNLIIYRVALELAPSLPFRAAQSQSADTSKFSRFKVDFPAFVESLQQAYSDNLLKLSVVDDTTAPVLFTLAPQATNLFPGG